MPNSLKSIEDAVHRRWKDLGYDALLPEERDYIVLWWLMVEVNNGSFDQYFFNNSGDAAMQALSALQLLGAEKTHAILQDALAEMELIGGYTSDCEARRRLLAADDEVRFDGPTNRFYEYEEDFVGMALNRVASAYKQKGIEIA